jgi:hypothetical protein
MHYCTCKLQSTICENLQIPKLCNMAADRKLVLAPALCFLCSKYGNCDKEALKLVIKDFYSVEEAILAKERLQEDLLQLKSSLSSSSSVINVPTIPCRRDGPNQHQHVLNDIFTLLVCCDQCNLFDLLPTYVTDSVDKIPCQRLLDRDMKFLLFKMDTYDTKLTDVYGKIAAILARLDVVTEALRRSGVSQAQAHAPAPVSLNSMSVPAASVEHVSHVAPVYIPPVLNINGPRTSHTESETRNETSIHRHSKPSQPAGHQSWAAAVAGAGASASAGAGAGETNTNTNEGSMSGETDNDYDNDNDGFTEYTSRKRKRISPLQSTGIGAMAGSRGGHASLHHVGDREEFFYQHNTSSRGGSRGRGHVQVQGRGAGVGSGNGRDNGRR